MGVENSAEKSHDLPPSLTLLMETFPDEVREVQLAHGDAVAMVPADALRKVMEYLKADARLLFDVLVDVTAVDFLGRTPRFEVVYHLLSLPHNRRLRIRVGIDGERPKLESLTALWGSANWLEREVWDMFGIEFTGHPELKRILLYPEFEGHPLRKDYPIRRRQPLIGPKN
jgi:NADH-quinone oxidoreductase subunit C